MATASNPVRKVTPRTRKLRYSEATRHKLLDAAGHVFAEHGYYSATIRQICKRAGANVAAVNYHFKDKLGLYGEVLGACARAAHVEQMRAALDQSGSPEKVLREVIRARVRGLANDGLPDWYFQLFVREIAQPTPALARMINKVARPIYERMLGLIGGIIGLAAEDEKTRLCAYSVMGQILFYAFAGPLLERLSPNIELTPERLDRIADHIADFSLAYLREIRSGRDKPGGGANEVQHD